MRALASKLRDQIEDAEENMVDERQEDKPSMSSLSPQTEIIGPMVKSIREGDKDHQPVRIALPTPITVRKNNACSSGPNGIGKAHPRALADGPDFALSQIEDPRLCRRKVGTPTSAPLFLPMSELGITARIFQP